MKILVFTFAFAVLCLQCCISIGLNFIMQDLDNEIQTKGIINTRYQSIISFFTIHIYFAE